MVLLSGAPFQVCYKDNHNPSDWNGLEIETDDDDYQELRGWAQDSLADFVDVIDDEVCDD